VAPRLAGGLTRRFSLSLSFADPDLESRFRADRAQTSLPVIRSGELGGIWLWPAAGVLIPLVGPVNLPVVIVVVIAMVALDIVLLMLLRRSPSPGLLETVGAVSCALNGLAVVVLALAAVDLAPYVVPALMLVAIYTFVVFQLPPAPGLAATAVYLAAYLLVPIQRPSFAGTMIDLVVLTAAVGLGAAASYLLERSARERFMQARLIETQQAEIVEEQAKSDRLLRNVLPARIAAQLREAPGALAEGFESATVLFADVVGFTPLSERLGPQRTAEMLNVLVSQFDQLAEGLGLEKIKTIGDAYLVVGGVPDPLPDHACRVVRMGLAMIASASAEGQARDLPLAIRVGVHSGPVVAGVIGLTKFAYDVWGDTVNVAARLQAAGVPGEVQASEATTALLDDSFVLVSRGALELKGKGAVPAFLVRAVD